MANRWRLTTALIVAVGLGGMARASVVVPLTLEEMTDQAEGIVVGKCMSLHSYWQDRKIWTDATFRVDQRLKGRSSAELKVRALGGKVTEPAPVAMLIEGGVEFSVGETSLLFTKRRPDGTDAVLGLAQGRVPLVQDAKSGKWHSSDGRPLEDLLSRIEARLKGSAPR